MVVACFINLLLFGLVVAIWVFVDSRRRGGNTFKWTLGAFVMAPIFASIYHARRPLLGEEVREGGPDWIVARNFALLWLPYMGIAVFWTIITLFFTDDLSAESDSSMTSVRNWVTMLFMLTCWFVPAAISLLLSVMLVEPDTVETVGDDIASDDVSEMPPKLDSSAS